MKLDEEAARAIDTSWHSSWHWERRSDGSPTTKGWRQAHADCLQRIRELEADLERLKALEPKLLGVILGDIDPADIKAVRRADEIGGGCVERMSGGE